MFEIPFGVSGYDDHLGNHVFSLSGLSGKL